MIVICGGNINEGIAYSREFDLGYPRSMVLKDFIGLYGVPHGTVLRLVGTFHNRKDTAEIFREAAIRRLKIEDLT